MDYYTLKSGGLKLMDFNEERLNMMYERFLLNYFKKEHPYILTHASRIKWQIDEGYDELLPVMKTLEYENKILILDAKFYKHNISENYGRNTTSHQ